MGDGSYPEYRNAASTDIGWPCSDCGKTAWPCACPCADQRCKTEATEAYARGRADGIAAALEAVEQERLKLRATRAQLRSVKPRDRNEVEDAVWGELEPREMELRVIRTKLRRMATGAASASKGEK